MNAPKAQSSAALMRWVAFALGATILFSVTFIWLRHEERSRLDVAARIARNYGRATDDLSTGFLHITLGARAEGPWDKARGVTLLHQALRELEAATLELPEGDLLRNRFRQELAAFEKLLAVEETHAGTLANEVALHVALGQLKAVADDVDARLRSDQQKANDRFDRNLDSGIAAGIFALAVLAAFAFRTLAVQRRVDLQLKDSEAKFRSVVEQSIAGVVMVRDGVVLYGNPRAAEIFGRQVETLTGMPVIELVPERYRAECATLSTRLLGGEAAAFSGPVTGLRSDGSEVRLLVQANPMLLSDTPAVLGILQDVSEKYRLESERLEALQLLERISNSSGDAIFAKDLAGRFKFFNAQAERISGFPASQVLGHDDFATLPAEDATRTMADDQAIIREGKVRRAEWTLPTPHGNRTLDVVKGPLHDKHGRVAGVFGVARDITERKAEEQALQESRAELEAVIDALDEGLIIYSPEGRILKVNPAAQRINGVEFDVGRGYSAEERQALLAFETIDGQPIPFEDWPAQRVLRGEQVRNLECVLINAAKGLRRTLNCSGGLVLGGQGQVRLGLLTFTDITERRQAQAALIQAQRLESLGTLAAGIAHDFNNILLAITGNASLADQELPPNHPAHGSLLEVQRAGQRAKDLVRRILLFARAEDSQRRTLDIGEVVGEAVELMRPTLPARIQLLSSLPATVLPVHMDATQIHQVLVNLITNAAHAIDDAGVDRRGQIQLRLEEAVFDAPLQFGTRNLPAGRYVRLVIDDDGCGMDAPVLDRVFDPFFTTKVVGRGTGLGLSIVRGIVTDHGGSIALTSAVGKGTRVEILLPRAGGETVAAPAKPETVAGEGRRVLYIDDEPALVSLVTRYLRRQGYEVTGSTDPQEGLQAFAAHPDRYDLVVTDLSMPQMSGFEVARAVREQSSTVPVIMMSGYVRPEDRERALALGVREVLLKPATVEELCQSINRQLL